MKSHLFSCLMISVYASIHYVYADTEAIETTEIINSDPQSDREIKIHGFASQGFLYSVSNNYLSFSSTKGTFDFTEAGINFSKPLTDKLTTGFQLFSRRLGSLGNFDAHIDWFYLDYHWKDWLGFRVGRIKIPFGLYNEINDIDSARNYVLLPQSVYPAQNRDFLLAQNGVEIYGYRAMDGAGALDYRLYAGTIFLDRVSSFSSGSSQITNLNVPYLFGGRLLWETPLTGLRGGISFQSLRMDLNSSAIPNVRFGIPALLWVASLEYTFSQFQFSAEYSKWNAGLTSSNPSLFPDTTTVSERKYAMLNYQFLNWLRQGLYYSIYYPVVDNQNGVSSQLKDLALFVRFDLNSNWLLKVEGHYIYGTAGLSSTLNNNTAIKNLTSNWGAIIIKTTGYF